MKQVSWVIFFFTTLLTSIQAQTPIGHRTKSFSDPSRNNRSIPSEIYYPATASGNNTPLASGAFPVIVFGHGFLMPYSAYAYLKDAMVPEGYIVVFPTTEGSLLPNHLNFGLDLAFLVNALHAEGTDPASPFYQHVDSTSVIMGHSMGGGASFLGCANNTTPTAMVTFAAAETNPSAIAAALNITIPTLVFAASVDCVTPPATNQIPMYENLASDCKTYINITGGGHCYFADYNFQCSLGETSCQQNFTITREEQHDVTLDFLKPYLDAFLKNHPDSWSLFTDSLAASQRINYMMSCLITGENELPKPAPLQIYPVPAGDYVWLEHSQLTGAFADIQVTDLSGRIVFKGRSCSPYKVDVSSLSAGAWVVRVLTPDGVLNGLFLKR